MPETQLDRIENMLKILVAANTAIDFKDHEAEMKKLSDAVKNYSAKQVGVP